MQNSNSFLNAFFSKARQYADVHAPDLNYALSDESMSVEEKMQLIQLQHMIHTEFYQKKTKGYLKFFYVISLISLIASAVTGLIILYEMM